MLRDTAYHILADLIYKGALFLNASICGTSFIFKTINQREMDIVKLRSGLSDSPDYGVKFNINFLAQSLYMVDGFICSDEHRMLLYNFFLALPNSFYQIILNKLIELKDIAKEAGEFIEGFCYTDQSRYMYKTISLKGFIILNDFQDYWIRVNQLLDEEEDYDQKFSLALLIASATNPKGTRRIRAQHEAEVQKIKEKRKKIAREGLIRKVSWSEQGWSAPVDTAEELVAELNRQMMGLKDRHDRFIEAYLRSLQDESEKREQEAKKKLEEYRKEHESESGITGYQRQLTPEEVKKMMSEKDNNLVMVESEDMTISKEMDRFYSKIGRRILTPKG